MFTDHTLPVRGRKDTSGQRKNRKFRSEGENNKEIKQNWGECFSLHITVQYKYLDTSGRDPIN